MLARPTVGERKAKCPGRAYRCKQQHEGDTNVGAVTGPNFEVPVDHLRARVHVTAAWELPLEINMFAPLWFRRAEDAESIWSIQRDVGQSQ